MVISLYTSRIVLATLGVEDYGIYNVVGGIVAMLSFLNNSLSSAFSRFLTFSIGEKDQNKVTTVFGTARFIHLLLALVIIMLGESLGQWFLFNKLVIPHDRLLAASFVLHFSIFTAALSIISVPYNALIIAKEKMGIFAYISIIEVILKLAIVFLLTISRFDKLILYAFLTFLVQLLIRTIYVEYCKRNINESKAKITIDKNLIKSVGAYACWTLNGNLAVIGYTQGVNMLLNMFFGPVVNAARSIAVVVQSATMNLVQNFQTGIQPQIVKSYAQAQFDYMHTLIIAASKYGFYLMCIIVFPLFLFTESVLNVWLGQIPEYSVPFVRIMLVSSMLLPLRQAMINSIHATGDIKKFQVYEGISLLTVVPICYISLKFFHVSPEFTVSIYIFIELFTQFIRVKIVLPKVGMHYKRYTLEILFPIFKILFPFIIPLVILKYEPINIWQLGFGFFFAIVYSMFCIYLLGLSREEKKIVGNIFKRKILKL